SRRPQGTTLPSSLSRPSFYGSDKCPQLLELVARVDIEEHAVILDVDQSQALAKAAENGAGALVAAQRAQLREQLARQKHGVAAAALEHWRRRQRLALEGLDELGGEVVRHMRHVAEEHEERLGIGRQHVGGGGKGRPHAFG